MEYGDDRDLRGTDLALRIEDKLLDSIRMLELEILHMPPSGVFKEYRLGLKHIKRELGEIMILFRIMEDDAAL